MEELARYRGYILRVAFFAGAVAAVLFMIGVIPASCGGAPAVAPSPTPQASPSPPPTSTPQAAPVAQSQAPSPTATVTSTATVQPAERPVATSTATPDPSPAPAPSPTATPRPVPTSTPAATPVQGDGDARYMQASVRANAPQHLFEVGFYGPPGEAGRRGEHILRFVNGSVYALDGRTLEAGQAAETISPVAAIAPATDYQALVLVQPRELGGTHYYLSGGEYGELEQAWTLVWRSDYIASEAEALITVQASDASVRILASGAVQSMTPAVLDLFTSEGAGARPLRGRSPTAGASGTWETPDSSDAWVVLSGSATSNQARQTAVIDSGAADGMVSAGLNPWKISGVVVRYTDPNNWIGIRRKGADDSIIIVRRERGASTQVADAPVPTDIDAGGRLDVFLSGPRVRVYVNGFLVHDIAEPFNQEATKHGLWSFGETTHFLSFGVWPDVVSFQPR